MKLPTERGRLGHVFLPAIRIHLERREKKMMQLVPPFKDKRERENRKRDIGNNKGQQK